MADPQRVPVPQGIPYQNADGELGVLSGRVTTVAVQPVPSSWVQRFHPLRNIWVRDELKQRASYLATRQHLTPFLVPHRFEGQLDPTKLSRARLAYGVGLNQAYLQEIFGHIRSTPAHYTWGKLSTDSPDEKDITSPPKTGVAERMWWDATADGISWSNFFEGDVLEWLLTSPSALVLVDTNNVLSSKMTVGEAEAKGIRSSLKLIPFSWVEDYGRGPQGYRWLKIAETLDRREPEMPNDDTGFERRHIIYELLSTGVTRIRRFNDKGVQIGGDILQTIKNMSGQGILPLVEVKFGKHPDVTNLGTGLLMGLDDIVIDIFNLLTEIREAYRDAVFTFLAYRGSDAVGVQTQLEGGTRLVHIGEDATSTLEVVGAHGGEVEAGLGLLEHALKNWSLSAKRRAMEQQEATQARSGVSIKAEFQLDLVPVMVSITETLDLIETNAMFILAQIEGFTPKEANVLVVRREKDFQMEQEASRISRIIGEFLTAVPGMPSTMLKKMIMRWAESIDFLDLEEEITMGDGTKKKLREIIDQEAADIADADTQARIRQNQFGILGAAALGAATGGNSNGGGDGTSTSPSSQPGEITPPLAPLASPSVKTEGEGSGAVLASIQALGAQVQTLAEKVTQKPTAVNVIVKREGG